MGAAATKKLKSLKPKIGFEFSDTKGDQGVTIIELTTDWIAISGMQTGDVLKMMNDTKITNSADVFAFAKACTVGQSIVLALARGDSGGEVTGRITVTVGALDFDIEEVKALQAESESSIMYTGHLSKMGAIAKTW